MLDSSKQFIYHLVLKDKLKKQIKENYYHPESLKKEGFIHCCFELSTALLVAESYFYESIDDILLLKIDLKKISEQIKVEKASPIKGAKSYNHLKNNTFFPHIYGPLNLNAIIEVNKLIKENEKFKVSGKIKYLTDFF